jgi:hypothetical protein
VIFYELLCGRRPHEPGGESGEAKAQPPEKTVPSARSINPAVPHGLDAVCSKAMAPRPADRYPSARALAEAIEKWQAQRGRARGRLLLGAMTSLLGIVIGLALIDRTRPRAQDHPTAPAGVAKRADIASRPIAGEDSSGAGMPKEAGAAGARSATGKNGSLQFVGLADTGKYHLSDCSSIRQTDKHKLIPMESQQQAEARLYVLCGTCARRLDKLRHGEKAGVSR